ncbi:hypothetical protein SLA2020_314770 [Shorea laevis]
MDNSDSQISGDSSSIPSEPPDIRNWFSSYKYESFVLDTYHDFGNYVSRDSESNKDGFVNEENKREKEENLVESGEKKNSFDSCEDGSFRDKDCLNQSLSEIPNSLESASLVSEPPDIRNWFGSYVYESPVLDTTDDFKSSVNHKRECEKDAFFIRDSLKEKVENAGKFQDTKSCQEQDVSGIKCSSGLVKSNSSFGYSKNEDPSLYKILDAHNSSSCLSEPPDIKNWFSSYTYETPYLHMTDEFGDSPFEDEESEEHIFAVEDSNKEEEENCGMMRKVEGRDRLIVDEKLSSSHFEKCITSLGKDDQENESLRKSIHEAGDKENVCGQDNLCFEKILGQSLEAKSSQASDISSHKYAAKSNEEGCVSTVQQGSPIRSVHRSNDKENEGGAVTVDGFVTTRKNRLARINQENSRKRPQEILVECSRKVGSITRGGKDPVEKRRVLAETTNIQHCDVMEVSGKWRCPQRNKPHQGPPLKQLRLEQWVRRV